MADNPDILSLGIEPDDEGFQQLNQNVDETTQHLDALGQTTDALAASVDDASQRIVSRFGSIADAARNAATETQQSIDVLRSQLDDVGGDTGGGDDGGDGGGGGISLRGIGALGMLARQGGAGGVGNALRTVAELQRAQGVFESLGESVGPVVESLGGLGAVFPPLAIAVGAVTAAVVAFNIAEAQHKTDIDNEIAQTDAYYKTIQTGTTQSINLELQKQKIVLQGYQDELQAIEKKIELEKQSPDFKVPEAAGNALVNTIPGGGIVNLLTGGGAGDTIANKLDPALSDLQKRSDELTKQINDTQNAVKGETDALSSQAVAANDAKAKAAEADRQFLQSLDQQSTLTKQLDADTKLSAQANRDKQKALQDEYNQTAQNITALQEHGIATKEDQQKLDEYQKKLHELNIELGGLAENLTKAENAEIQKAQDTETAQENSARARAASQEAALQPGSAQDTEARNQIRQKTSRAEEAAAQQGADRIADIRTKLGQDESRIQTDYNRQLEDDQTHYNDSLQKLVTDNNRQQQTDEIDHQQKLADIRQQAKDSEFTALLDRNFLQLAVDERNKQSAESKENTSYQQREQALQAHLQQQEQDLATSLVQQERQQQVAEQRKLADAQTAADNSIQQEQVAEQRKEQALRTSQQQQLQDLTTSEGYKIQIIRVSLQNELALYRQQEQAKIDLITGTTQAIIAQSQQAQAAVSGGNANPLGNVIGGIETQVNDFFGGIFR